MIALFKRDLRLNFRAGGGSFIGLLFFLIIVVLTPFAMGPDLKQLAQIGPGILWIGAVLASILGLDGLFKNDLETGALAVMQLEQNNRPFFLMILTKCAAHWCATCLPLVLAAPLYGLLLNMSLEAIIATSITLLIGTPAIIFIGSLAAAITASLPKGGLLIAILVLPLIVPVVIFGLASSQSLTANINASNQSGDQSLAPLLMLSALTLFFTILGPLASSYILTQLNDEPNTL